MLRRKIAGQRQRKRGNHGIAGAGHIEDFLRLRRDMYCRTFRHQRKTALGARRHHRVNTEPLHRNSRRTFHRRILILRRRRLYRVQFLQVRRNVIRPPIFFPIAALRIDDNWNAPMVRRFDQPRTKLRRQNAFAVIGQNQRPRAVGE